MYCPFYKYLIQFFFVFNQKSVAFSRSLLISSVLFEMKVKSKLSFLDFDLWQQTKKMPLYDQKILIDICSSLTTAFKLPEISRLDHQGWLFRNHLIETKCRFHSPNFGQAEPRRTCSCSKSNPLWQQLDETEIFSSLVSLKFSKIPMFKYFLLTCLEWLPL